MKNNQFRICVASLIISVVTAGAWFWVSSHQSSRASVSERAENHPDALGNSSRPRRTLTEGNAFTADSEIRKFNLLLKNGDYTGLVDAVRGYQGLNGTELWELAQAPGIPEMTRRNLLDEAIRILSKTMPPEALLELVQSSLGPGVARTGAQARIFRHQDMDFVQFKALIDRMDLGEEREVASRFYAMRLAGRRDIGPDFYKGLLNDPLGRKVALGALSGHPTALRGEPLSAVDDRLSNALTITKELLSSGRVDKDFLGELSIEIAKTLPFQVYDQLQSNDLLKQLNDSDLQKVTESMARQDPRRFLDMAISGNEGSVAGIRLGVIKLMQLDSREAMNWYQQNEKSLNNQQRMESYSAFGEHSAHRKEFTDAWEWVNKIEDPAVRKRAEGQVWPKERDAVRSAVSKNPEQTLQSIIAGQSQHDTYWIEEAMATWISKDPDKAENWYKKNWQSLPPEKSQYVAAAYAKHSLAHGDPIIARQWTNLIQNRKTRERIEASITKAETGGRP